MKSIAFALSLVGLAACSQAPSASVADSAPVAAREAFVFTATLGDVKAHAAPAPAVGLWTDIELQYQVACTETLATFNYNLRAGKDGGIDLLVSAIGTRAVPQPGVFQCQSIQLVTKTVTVPGIVSADAVHLVNLSGATEAMLKTTKSLEAIGLELVGVKSLCPAGLECVVGGTVAELKTTRGVSCVDKIGPVTSAVASDDATGHVKLAVSAIDMVDSRLVACAAFPRTVEISLPMIFVDAANLDLSVVGGN